MMKELLKPMMGEGGGEEETGVLGEYACEALGRGLSAAGGLGIADRIVQELSRSGIDSKAVDAKQKAAAAAHPLKH
ncbi:MAG TPA: hypothetical protein VL967_11445 [Terracidiphilus sp.]|nr:hypothetical protein [Terracidiphilus sp.]